MVGSKRARPWIPQPSARVGSVTSVAAATATAAAAVAFVLAALSLPGADAFGLQVRCSQLKCLVAPEVGTYAAGRFGRRDPHRRAHIRDSCLLASSSTSVCDQQGARGDELDEQETSTPLDPAAASAAGAAQPGLAAGAEAAAATAAAATVATATAEESPSWLPLVGKQEKERTSSPVPPPPADAAASAASVQRLQPSSPLAGGAGRVSSPATNAVRQNVGQRGDGRHGHDGGKQRGSPPWGEAGSGKVNAGASGIVSDSVNRSVGVSVSGSSGSGSGGSNNRRDGGGGGSGSGGARKKGYRRFRDNDVRMFLLERGLSQWEVRKVLPVIRRDPKLMTDIGVLAAKMQAIADLLESAASWYAPGGETLAEAASDAVAPGDAGASGEGEPTASAGGAAARLTAPDLATSTADATEGTSNASSSRNVGAGIKGGNGVSGGGNGGGRAGLEESAAREGARLHAYQLISSEPRLLLLQAEPTLAGRLRYLLDSFPALRGYWNARLRKAACLLAIPKETLEARQNGLKELFPQDVDVQAIVSQAPLLLRHSTENVAESLAVMEKLVPGIRIDRVLRSAPQLLVQQKGVASRRLAHLRQVLGLNASPEAELEMIVAPSQDPGAEGRGTETRTLARFANVFPQVLVMDPTAVRAKIEGIERLLPGIDSLAVVSTRPHLLGFDIRRNVSLKVSRLRVLFGPQTDLAVAVTRCPSLLTMSSHTAAGKLEKLQEALPSGLDARSIVAKEPRVMSLDMGSTVPRKIGDLARAFAVHADADAEETAAMMAQVLRCNPNALRFDTATLASKLVALRKADLPPSIVRSIVRDAPRCLSAGAKSLGDRVSTLKKAFPTIPLERLLGEAPCLLQKQIVPGDQVALLQELFPSSDPIHLVEGAPMLLALSDNTLRVKSEAWRHILESSVDVPWEQAVADFPQLLCQGMGRAARIAFLLRESSSPACVGDDSGESSAANGDGESEGEGAVARSAGSSSGGAVGAGTKLMSAADAYSEVCRRVADFASDNPAYPAFVDLLLSEACRGEGDEGQGFLAGDALVLSAGPAAEGAVMAAAAASSSGGAAASGAALAATSRIGDVLVGNQRQRYQWREWQNVQQRDGSATGSGGGPSVGIASTAALSVSTAEISTTGASVGGGSGGGKNGLQTPSPSLSEEGSRDRSSPTPLQVANELAVMGERALGAALTAVAKESGGKAAAAMLLSPPVRHDEDR